MKKQFQSPKIDVVVLQAEEDIMLSGTQSDQDVVFLDYDSLK